MTRSVRFDSFGGPGVLHLIDAPIAEPTAGQIRVRVKTSGLNPVDSIVRSGGAVGRLPIAPPSGLGNEFAGIVEAVGTGVPDIRVGTPVIGAAPFRSLTEALLTTADTVVVKPDSLDWNVAATLPVAGTTGYNSANSLRLGPADTVLISAAAGGVGLIASQIAIRAGATVIGTASESHHDYLRRLGVIPITYGSGLIGRVRDAAPGGLNAALENHSAEAIETALELGVPVTRINSVVGNAQEYGVAAVGGDPSPATIGALAGLVVTGAVQVPIHQTFALDDIQDAYRLLDTHHLLGKVVVRIDG
ncbi:NADP-dependent oxidoreductase [Streptomyces sp. NBC_00988]|uniref:NADP-dependent oxidoreductase n=1 Tax=Streptomyces sp. NBC_00988 TaxID=2903704 RepID=UPI0038651682|nr:NADP-dependent oxidoreductase [Streptomyces sp. NBC_00988]